MMLPPVADLETMDLLALREPVFIVTERLGVRHTHQCGTSTRLFALLRWVAAPGCDVEILDMAEGDGRWLTRAGVHGLNCYLRAAGDLSWWNRLGAGRGHLSRYGWAEFKWHLALHFA